MQTSVGFLILSLAFAVNGASLSSRIVGGSAAPDGKYPYHVALWYGSSFSCGGSIIDERHILTAAHCLRNRRTALFDIQVGSNILGPQGFRYKVEKLMSPTSSMAHYDDIGIIRLSEKIIFTDKVQPIALPDEDLTHTGSSAVLTGWGRLWAGGPAPSNLQEIELKVFDQKKCQRIMPSVTPKEICTLTKQGEGACNGDSGGPLVADGFQIGIVSRGAPCALGMPDVFTRVHSYRHWIRNATNLH